MKKNQKVISSVIFIVYLAVLIWVIIFKTTFSLRSLDTIRNINLIPFGDSTIINGSIGLKEIIWNGILFVPFGLYLSVLMPKSSSLIKVGIIASVSLTFEIIQYALSIGATDITDLIMNTFGGVVGIVIYRILYQILKTTESTNMVVNIIAVIGVILIFGLMFLILSFN